MTWQQLLITLAALVYLLLPLDIIPEFVPILGVADDIVLLAAAISSWFPNKKET